MTRKTLFRTLLLGGVLAVAAVPAAGLAAKGGPGAHGGAIAARLMEVADQIGMTEAQKAQVKGILESHKAEAQQLRQDTRTALKSLDEAITGGADNDTIAELAIEAHGLRGEQRELKQQVRQEVGAVLTPEQKAQLKAMRAERREAHGGEGRRHRGGERGGFEGGL